MTPQQLKNSILQMAIQGKLVEQRPEEGTGEELYQQIQKEKLVKEDKIKKQKPLPEIAEDEMPFEIPRSWRWVYIGDIFQHNTGKALNGASGQGKMLTYITTSNLYWNRFEFTKLKEMPFTETEIEKCTVKKNDLLVCEGGDFGRAAIWTNDKPMRIQNHIHRLRAYYAINIKFYYLIFLFYKNSGFISGKGIGIQGLSSNALHKLIVPLPPLIEQIRIVAKFEELMPFVDRYATAYDKLQSYTTRFPNDLKKSILQQAIQGKLIPQDPNDEPASVLFEKITKEKEKLVKEGKIKKQKPLPEITEDEIPFEIPESWKWVRWGNLSYSIQYGYNAPAKSEGRIRMVRISDIQNGKVTWQTVPFCDIGDADIQTYQLKENDILFARTGGTVGKSFLVKKVPEKAIYAGYLIRTRYESTLLVPEYLKMFMESKLYWDQLHHGTIATAQPNCNGRILSKMIIPIPPLAEQKRIVNKLNELISQCERLTRK